MQEPILNFIWYLSLFPYCSSWDFLPSSYFHLSFTAKVRGALSPQLSQIPTHDMFSPYSSLYLHIISAYCRWGFSIKELAGFLGKVKEEETLCGGGCLLWPFVQGYNNLTPVIDSLAASSAPLYLLAFWFLEDCRWTNRTLKPNSTEIKNIIFPSFSLSFLQARNSPDSPNLGKWNFSHLHAFPSCCPFLSSPHSWAVKAWTTISSAFSFIHSFIINFIARYSIHKKECRKHIYSFWRIIIKETPLLPPPKSTIRRCQAF